jgi:biotin carboxyl carrier protein
MKKFLIKVNGSQYEVEVEEIREDITNIETVSQARAAMPSPATVAAPKAAPAPKKPAAPVNNPVPAGANTVTAPIPGVVLGINVNVGDNVKKGQVLMILEAMKMENEIVAPSDGQVSSINITKGASVNAGDVLVSLS